MAYINIYSLGLQTLLYPHPVIIIYVFWNPKAKYIKNDSLPI